MPNWKIHLEVAKRVGKKIKYTKEEMELFLLANILPDINNCYIVKDISLNLDHDFTHYRVGGVVPYIFFYNTHRKETRNPIIAGYLVHLYTDYLFNKDFYLRSQETELKDCTHDELRVIKQSDFRSFNDNYIDNKLIVDDVKAAEEAVKVIDRVSVNSEDIQKVIDFLDKQEKSNVELQFYTMEELEELMNKTVRKIECFLSTIWVIRRK